MRLVELLSGLLELLWRTERSSLSLLVRWFANCKIFLAQMCIWTGVLVLELRMLKLLMHQVLLVRYVEIVEVKINLLRLRDLRVIFYHGWWLIGTIHKIILVLMLHEKISGRNLDIVLLFRSNTHLRTQLRIRSKRDRSCWHRNLILIIPTFIRFLKIVCCP
jgi:hypothetical protein